MQWGRFECANCLRAARGHHKGTTNNPGESLVTALDVVLSCKLGLIKLGSHKKALQQGVRELREQLRLHLYC